MLVKRQWKVVRKVRESETIVSFYLRTQDGSPVPAFNPGQFLTLELAVPGQVTRVVRNYSVSSWPEAGSNELRLTIKREGAPVGSPELTPGIGSTFMHDRVEEGHVLEAIGPVGQFYLKQESDRPVVLLSGGVGITPMVSMAHALAREGKREVYFIHACDSGTMHAFAEEIGALCEQSGNISQYICYRFPGEQDRLGVDYHSEGMLSREVLRSVLPLGVYDFYLCGPPPFMQAMYEALLGLGVQKSDINYEFFGPASLLTARSDEKTSAEPAATEPTEMPVGDGPLVTFAGSDIRVPWDHQYDNLLDFAEAHGIAADFSCRVGICNECKCQIQSGEVEYGSEPLDMPEQGELLPCCARPLSDIQISL